MLIYTRFSCRGVARAGEAERTTTKQTSTDYTPLLASLPRLLPSAPGRSGAPVFSFPPRVPRSPAGIKAYLYCCSACGVTATFCRRYRGVGVPTRPRYEGKNLGSANTAAEWRQVIRRVRRAALVESSGNHR